MYCQKNSSALTTTSYMTIQPLLTSIITSFLIGEAPPWSIFVGGVFIVSGLFTVALSRFREQKAARKASDQTSPSQTILLEEGERPVIDPQIVDFPVSSLHSEIETAEGPSIEIVDVGFDQFVDADLEKCFDQSTLLSSQ